MFRFLLVALLTALFSYLGLLYFPWWTPFVVALVFALVFPQSKWRSFAATGLGVAVLYSLLSLIADLGNEHILSTKIAVLFKVPSFLFVHLITVFIGFITAGLGGLLAASARWLSSPLKKVERKDI